MPNVQYEYDYSDNDYQLIGTQQTGNFTDSDYIRLTIINNTVSNIIDSTAFYSSLSSTPFDINITPHKRTPPENGNILTTKTIGIGTDANGVDYNDFKIYKNPNDQSIYLKPNELLNKFNLPDGNYTFRIEFLRQVNPTDDFYQFVIKEISTSRSEVRLKLFDQNITKDSEIISHLENVLNDGGDSFAFKHVLNLGHRDPLHNRITNYHFDTLTDGADNQSIIFKLYNNITDSITTTNMVTIEEEVLITQILFVRYYSDVPPVISGTGLTADYDSNWESITNWQESLVSQNYNDLTSSVSNTAIETIISKSAYDYPNINTDFNEFENHTFFGSAKRKLINFKNKVKTIQNAYGGISASLYGEGVGINEDSDYLIQLRENLFTKIDNEINSFTPYERFLYFDGQNKTTASAPGIGEIYNRVPFAMKSTTGFGSTNWPPNQRPKKFDNKNAFREVYKVTQSLDTGATTEWFRGSDHPIPQEYRAESKPFYNYSGSVYLSFIIKGDQGFHKMTGSGAAVGGHVMENRFLPWTRRPYDGATGGFKQPADAFNHKTLVSQSFTGSEYRRYVFRSSHSYWAPTSHQKTGTIPDANLVSDFGAGSNQVEILSGSIKTGSLKFKAGGYYQHLSTVVTQSGVPFSGSMMPSGDYFAVRSYHPRIGQCSGSWNVDTETSGSSVTNAMLIDFTSRGNTGSIRSTPAASSSKVAAGMDVFKETYGKSFFFESESKDRIEFRSSTDFDFSRSSSFSLSVWAKRFHQATESADPTIGTANIAQSLIGKGSFGDSYGIDYHLRDNQIRAGLSGGNGINYFLTGPVMEHDMTESFHHIVMTYESGSTDGFKLYIDGMLANSKTTIANASHTAFPFTGSNEDMDFITSSYGHLNHNGLHIGGNSVVGSTSQYYNGHIQYPRVYGKTLSENEVLRLYHTPDGVLDAELTDIKVTIKDPRDAQPFSQVYHTSSTDWTNWYDGMYDSASAFDTDNIHSLENNLPDYIKRSSEYDDLKDFLGLQGEQYDIIRNHIDSLGTLHDRGYTKLNSPPTNTYPVLLKNMGWEAINPFSGSLSENLAIDDFLSNVTSVDTIKNNTWRKTLNNLIYIYKSKGTQNSVRALLNVYGYPPDVLSMQEFAGSSNEIPIIQSSPGYIKDVPPDTNLLFDTNLRNNSGSINFTIKKEKLYHYDFANKSERTLDIDWWMDSADINTIEFVYKHDTTTNTQTILKSSGSGTTEDSRETLWDLRLVPSADGVSSSFEFRLNNSNTGSVNITASAVSMSTDYAKMHEGQLWNVMLQRISSSISGTFEYRLHSALQDVDKIKTYNYVSMSVSGALETQATASWTFINSGSDFGSITLVSTDGTSKTYHSRITGSAATGTVSSSVVVFSTGSHSSSVADNFLAAVTSSNGHGSKFTVHRDLYGAVYLTQSIAGVDGNTSITKNLKFAQRTTPTPPSAFVGGDTDSTFYANQNWISSGSRHYLSSSNLVVGEKVSGSIAEIKGWTTTLSHSRFRQHTLNKFSTVGNSIDSHRKELVYHFKLNENYISESVSSSIVQTLPIIDSAPKTTLTTDYTFDFPAFLGTGSNIYGFDIIDVVQFGIQDNVVLSGNDNSIIINPRQSIVGNLNPNTEAVVPINRGLGDGNKPNYITSTKLEINRSPQDFINKHILNNMDTFNFELYYGNPEYMYSSSYTEFDTLRKEFFEAHPIIVDTNKFIKAHESIFNESITDAIKKISPARSTITDTNQSAGVTIKPHLLEKQKYEREEYSVETNPNLITGSIEITKNTDYKSNFILTSSYEQPKSGSIESSSITPTTTGSAVILPYSASIASSSMTPITTGSKFILPYSASLASSSMTPMMSGSTLVFPKSGSINSIATHWNKSFVNIHDSWGTSSADTHFLNQAAETGSYGNKNVGHVDVRYYFYSIGDVETYSASLYNSSKFDDIHRFDNRQMISSDIHKDITYESLIGGSIGSQVGRAVGKTRYFFTGSDGNIVLPANHFSKFSQPFKERMVDGTQNTDPGFLNLQNHVDYSTSSFYRIKVTGGELQAFVGGTKSPTIGPDDKIMR